MDEFSIQLNELLIETYRDIEQMEEQMLHSYRKVNLSISELHMLEAVAKGSPDGRNISSLAKELNITLSSVTVAINKLVKKGYVEKIKCDKDGRVARTILTHEGIRVNRVHQYFHNKMVCEISHLLSEDEKRVLLLSLSKLTAFFTSKLKKTENES